MLLMVLSRRRSLIKIVNIIGQKLRPEQCPEDNSKFFGRIEKKFYILGTKQGIYGEVYAKYFDV